MNKSPILYATLALSCLLWSFSSFSQTRTMIDFPSDNYQKEWKLIDSLEQQGLPRSALAEVEKLHARARRDNNPSQVIKTLIYRSKYQSEVEEDGHVNAIARLREEMNGADFPAKPILQSMVGELLMQYLDNNIWSIRDRTSTGEELPEDIKVWTADQLIAEASRLFEASLQYDRLDQVPIKEFEAITTEEKNSDMLRPTLFDFLAHRAIDHFMNERTYVTAPAYKFYLDQKEVFSPAVAFADLTFRTQDTSSFKYKTLRLFQDLLKRRLDDADPAALIDSDLKRLRFVYDNSILDLKDSLYLDALDKLSTRYARYPGAADALHQMASVYYSRGQKYQHGVKDEFQWELKKAKEICEKAVREYRDSYGAQQCSYFLGAIQRKSLNFQTEKVNLPETPFLVMAEYKNVNKVFLKAVRLKEEDREKLLMQDVKSVIRELNSKPVAFSTQANLPDEGDFQQHTTELKGDALPLGFYAVLLADNPGFKTEDGVVSYLYMYVSKIGYLQRRDEDNSVQFLVLDRDSGAPLEKVRAEFFAPEYNQRRRATDYKKIGEAYSDRNGLVRVPLPQNTYFRAKFTLGPDELFWEDGYSSYSRSIEPAKEMLTHFFMDRAIYRPGQTAYFKGIVLQKDETGKPSIVPGQKVVVTLYDLNEQQVGRQELVSNDYGTIQGAFALPRGGMLGSMRIESSAGESSMGFRVEEYKRPKFEVVFQPLDKSYALDDEVTVNGTAQAFAGSNVDGAQVRYRVVREVRFPWLPWWYWRGGFPPFQGEQMEIANGLTTTAEDGSFSVTFTAVPDRSVSKDRKPEFIFTVYADVTDISGETRSSEKSIHLAYLGLKVDALVSEQINRSGKVVVPIRTENLDGQPMPAKGTVQVFELKSPDRIFINRYWDKPHRQIIREEAFRSYFPHFAYGDEDESHNWPQQKMVFSGGFDTGRADSLVLNMDNWSIGHYALILKTEDDKGNAVEVKKIFALYDLETRKIPAGQLMWRKLSKDDFAVGEEAALHMATTAGNLNILVEAERRGALLRTEWIGLSDWQTVRREIGEADLGNLFFHLTAVKYNRAFAWQEIVRVPWSDKELQIEYTTFRDKLRPGQEEEWRIVIKGAKKEKVAAEMVAAMYDASLDQFAPNHWDFAPYPYNVYARRSWSPEHFTNQYGRLMYDQRPPKIEKLLRIYRSLNWFGFYPYQYSRMMRGGIQYDMAPAMAKMEMREEAVTLLSPESEVSAPPPAPAEAAQEPESPQEPSVRTNLNETVFFLPNLMTDADGNVVVRFTMNEALTRWKFLAFAHTKELEYGLTERSVVTQKELMVMPNPPRFMREGDKIEFTAKVSNLSEQALSGTATLELFDALTMQPIDNLFGNANNVVSFSAEAGQSDRLAWNLTIPTGKATAVTHRVVARAGNFSDGEESSLPVLTNRMLVTETLPLPVRGGQTKTYTLESLKTSGRSSTLQHHRLTLEFTSNPAWYAVQALPYLMEYPYDCVEQIFSRYYANTLAASVANANPAIKEMFEKWKNLDVLVSNLSKNEELKNLLLEETPWVLEAQSEEQQKKNIGLLFDLTRMGYEQQQSLSKLAELQGPDGGFAWFGGGPSNWFITQYIAEGLGHLDKLGIASIKEDFTASNIARNSIGFIDYKILEAYRELEKQVMEGRTTFEEDHLDHLAIHYLYARSFFLQQEMSEDNMKVFEYYLGQAEKYWLKKGVYQEGLIALALHRAGRSETPARIVRSLRERALQSEELGMYWKYDSGFFWHEMPIETHALLVEVFAEVAEDRASVEEMKVWLLKNKQTNHWKTTKATASAVYALLQYGDEWLVEDKLVSLSFPDVKKKLYANTISEAQAKAEPGSGYFKASWDSEALSKEYASVKVQNPNKTIAWGGLYWQYFEDLDKIDLFQETPLTIDKKLFKEESSDRGPVLKALSDGAVLEPGDKLIVRIELRVDRPMEYVHMKDMRASGLEPINVLSRYKWHGGLGFYESTRDAATNFFFDYLPRGTYVFEYPLRVFHKGDFSNGITTIQCMYAPEFTSHSEGVRIRVE